MLIVAFAVFITLVLPALFLMALVVFVPAAMEAVVVLLERCVDRHNGPVQPNLRLCPAFDVNGLGRLERLRRSGRRTGVNRVDARRQGLICTGRGRGRGHGRCIRYGHTSRIFRESWRRKQSRTEPESSGAHTEQKQDLFQKQRFWRSWNHEFVLSNRLGARTISNPYACRRTSRG